MVSRRGWSSPERSFRAETIGGRRPSKSGAGAWHRARCPSTPDGSSRKDRMHVGLAGVRLRVHARLCDPVRDLRLPLPSHRSTSPPCSPRSPCSRPDWPTATTIASERATYMAIHGLFIFFYFLTTFAIIIMVLDRARRWAGRRCSRRSRPSPKPSASRSSRRSSGAAGTTPAPPRPSASGVPRSGASSRSTGSSDRRRADGRRRRPPRRGAGLVSSPRLPARRRGA